MSTTVIPNVLLAVVPAESVALQVTVVGPPRANVPPEAGAQVTESEAPESSTAEAEKSTIAPEAAVASTVMSDGTVTTGAPKACVEAVPTGTSAESTMASAPAQRTRLNSFPRERRRAECAACERRSAGRR